MFESKIIEKLLGSTPSSDSPFTPPEVPGKKIFVHYWEEYNKGSHLVIEVETTLENTVQELMISMINNIYKRFGKRKDISNFVMRISSKDGLPKIDMPIVEIGQRIQNVSFVRFVLCEKDLDEKARLEVEEIKITEENDYSTKDTFIEPKSICRRLFCCISN